MAFSWHHLGEFLVAVRVSSCWFIGDSVGSFCFSKSHLCCARSIILQYMDLRYNWVFLVFMDVGAVGNDDVFS